MSTIMNHDREDLLLRAVQRDEEGAVGQLFELHRERLARMIRLRLDKRIQHRIDTFDVLQETYLVVSRRIHEFLVRREVSFFVWLRGLAMQKIVDLHREHLVTNRRDVRRERSLQTVQRGEDSSAVLARQLMANSSTPCGRASRGELLNVLMEMLAALPELDRDILVMRHLEQLTNREVAEALHMNVSSVSTRHLRALGKLKGLLTSRPEFQDLVSRSA